MKFILMLLFFSIATHAHSQGWNLSGKLLDENSKPLPGVTVRLNPGEMATQSDASGNFSFTALQAGEYRLTASFTGYELQTVTVAIQSSNKKISVRLRPAIQELEEVVIQGDQVALRKQEEALNLEVVNTDFIHRNLGGSMMQTLERLPGISTIGIGSGQSKPLIRGLGFNRVVVVDKGVKHEGQQWGADHGLELDQFAVEEVELLKGAASFAYGSDAIGGVIHVKPVQPPKNNGLGGSVDLIGKSNNNLYGTSVNLYNRKDKLFFDTRLTYQRYGDYRVPTDVVHIYDYPVRLYKNHLRNTAGKETGLHLNAGYLGNRFRSVFYLSHVYSKSGFFANAHGLEPRRVNTDLHDSSSRDIQMPNQQVNHYKIINRSELQLPGHRMEMEVGYQRNFRQEYSAYVNHGYMPPVYPADMPVSSELEREFDKHVYSINLRDHLTLGRHTLTAGINSEYQHNTIGGWGFLVPAFRQVTAGAFLYDKIELSNNLLLHAALRYDHGQIEISEYTDWFTSDITTPEGEEISRNLTRANNLNRTFNSLVWSVGVNYNLDKFQLKANLGKSFRMPIAKELAANGVNYHYFSYEQGNTGLLPEQSYQADLGVTWAEEKWSVQVNPFFNYFTNYIYLNPTPDHDYLYGAGNQVFAYTQSEVMRYGGEVQLSYNLLRSLRTELLGEYVYARQLSGDKKGYTLPFSPPPSVLLNLTWSPALNHPLHNTYFSFDYRLTSRQDNIVPPEKKTPGYQVVNIQLGTTVHLHKQPLQLSLQARNLLNTYYLNHTSFYRLIELPEAGRNIVLSLKIPFNK
ncbi:TonB-dependent receptor [Pontibacter sp. SGAir0037]|uniref:TonB-dependent receptor n=1 Tax=Pontibacter sp. SGAir0037 TaxID=2571030 RepID=UPI001F0EB295|nr:TonB-dependent receptor [Pontibacter sp. SGAir0037]